MTCFRLVETVFSVANRYDLSNTIHWESENKDLAICTYTVKTKSKGKKNVFMLTTTRPICGTTIDDEKNKPALYKFFLVLLRLSTPEIMVLYVITELATTHIQFPASEVPSKMVSFRLQAFRMPFPRNACKRKIH